MIATTKYIRDLINRKGIISIMWETNFDCKELKFEIIELFKKYNLTFSQAYNIISSIHSELEKRSLNSLID